MTDKKSLALRAKIIGVLLRDARLAAGKAPKECAAVLGITASGYVSFELGKKAISLPELELLAYYLDTSLTHFWGDEVKSEAPERITQVSSEQLVSLRQRIIGAQLKQARLEHNVSQKEMAAAIGALTTRIKAYEDGERPIPVPELETLAWVLGLKVEYFFEKQGPVGEWDAARRAFETFKDLPQDIQDFVCQPVNESYLRIAMRLASNDPDKLREIAAGLLDITF